MKKKKIRCIAIPKNTSTGEDVEFTVGKEYEATKQDDDIMWITKTDREVLFVVQNDDDKTHWFSDYFEECDSTNDAYDRAMGII